LLYARAALDIGNKSAKSEAISCAEQSLKGCLLSLLYVALSAVIFFVLKEEGYKEVEGDVFTMYLPLPSAIAFVLVFFIGLPGFIQVQVAIERTARSWELEWTENSSPESTNSV
jgi:hypothetical protein